MTRVILIRHGQTAWNKEERVRGQVEVPLDAMGMAQAEATAERVLKDFRPVAVYCSPLQRAVQTAEPIARRLGLEVQPVANLNDMNFGHWQGLSPDEVSQRWPEMARAWLKAPHTVNFPGGESLDVVKERSMTSLHQLIERHSDEELVIVGHTVVNRVLLCAVIGLDNSNYWRIGQNTCAINVFTWRRGTFFVEALNDTCHLRGLSTAEGDARGSPGLGGQGEDTTLPSVTIYTDGACKPNPGPGGWAAILRYRRHEKVLSGREPKTTNNRMELQAAVSGLEALRTRSRVDLHTDSRYLQQGMTEWLNNWVARGWRKSDGKPVINLDLWQRLYELTQQHDVHWCWVPGHSGDPNNERVNQLAYEAIYRTASRQRPISKSGDQDRRR